MDIRKLDLEPLEIAQLDLRLVDIPQLIAELRSQIDEIDRTILLLKQALRAGQTGIVETPTQPVARKCANSRNTSRLDRVS